MAYYHSEETGTKIDLDFVIYISDVFCPFFGEPYFYFLVIDDTEEIKTCLLPPERKIEYISFWKRIKKIKEVRLWFFENWIKIQREKRG